MANKVAVITGGGHGIGKAIADAFRDIGAVVHIIDIKPGDWFVGDVADKETLEAFAKSVIEESGHVDFLINNALPVMKGMLQTVLDVAKSIGYEQAELEVMAENKDAIAMYEKLGFEKFGTFPDNMKYADGSYMDAYWMMKKL